MIILAVDLGNVRTGLAVSDILENFAFPRGVITEYNNDTLVQKISEKAIAEKAGLIVVGLPKNMDGSLGFRAQECLETSEKIRIQSGIDTISWDERCTTVLAHASLDLNNIHGKKRKNTVDSVAAVMILENYLNYRKNLMKDD